MYKRTVVEVAEDECVEMPEIPMTSEVVTTQDRQ